MIYSYFVAKTNGDRPGGAGVQILLNDSSLFSVEDEKDAKNVFVSQFGAELEIGKVAYEDDDTRVYYAFADIKNMPDGWDYYYFGDLSAENCKNYELLKTIIQRLGY